MILPQRPEKGVKIKLWLVQLWEYCRSLQPKGDGKTCMVTRTPDGTTISCIVKGGGSGGGVSAGADDPYRGFFVLAIDAESKTPQIRVKDGTETLGGAAGVFASGLDVIRVPEQILPVTASGFVIFAASYAEPSWEISIEIVAELPQELTVERLIVPLGHVKLDKGALAVTQIYSGGIIFNNRYC